MGSFRSRLLLLIAICWGASAAKGEQANGTINISRQDEGFLFQEDDRKILFYQQKTRSLEGKYARANYVHPLYGLDEEVLTEDFPADHLHHRGVFWAWHQIWIGEKKIGDPWLAKDFVWDVRHVELFHDKSGSAHLKSKIVWRSPLWTDQQGNQKPILNETTIIRVFPAGQEIQIIDFIISLTAVEKDLSLGGSEDDKGYGGFSTRIRLPEDILFSSRNGKVTPKILAVEAGPWLDLSASFQEDKTRSGVTILCHPSLPGYPQKWILRKSRSMQNPVYPGRRPVFLSTEKPFVLRYRLLIHRGDIAPKKAEELWQEYKQKSTLSLP